MPAFPVASSVFPQGALEALTSGSSWQWVNHSPFFFLASVVIAATVRLQNVTPRNVSANMYVDVFSD